MSGAFTAAGGGALPVDLHTQLAQEPLGPEQLSCGTSHFLRPFIKLFVPQGDGDTLADVAMLCHPNGICVLSLVPRWQQPAVAAAGVRNAPDDAIADNAPYTAPTVGRTAAAAPPSSSAPRAVSVTYLASPSVAVSAKAMRKSARRAGGGGRGGGRGGLDSGVLQSSAPLLELRIDGPEATRQVVGCPVQCKLLEVNDRLLMQHAEGGGGSGVAACLARWHREGWVAVVQVAERDMPPVGGSTHGGGNGGSGRGAGRGSGRGSAHFLTPKEYEELRGLVLPFKT